MESKEIPLPLEKVDRNIRTNQAIPSSGPFLLVKASKKDGGGLTWVGVPEECNRCGLSYPMSWITVASDGKRFLCAQCDFDEDVLKNDPRSHECDSCKCIISMDECTIEYNQLICRRCSRFMNQTTHEQKTRKRGKYDCYFD